MRRSGLGLDEFDTAGAPLQTVSGIHRAVVARRVQPPVDDADLDVHLRGLEPPPASQLEALTSENTTRSWRAPGLVAVRDLTTRSPPGRGQSSRSPTRPSAASNSWARRVATSSVG